jgi:hypothetical protein
MNDMNAIVLADIRSMASLVIKDEKAAKEAFLAKKEQLTTEQTADDRKKLNDGKYRLAELEKLIQSVYEDKVLGNIPESVCINLLTKYEPEQKKLTETVAEISERLSVITKNENDVALFIDRLKKYVDVQELTREMCLELIEYITVDAYTADKPREIHIYYKLLDKPLDDKRCLYSK